MEHWESSDQQKDGEGEGVDERKSTPSNQLTIKDTLSKGTTTKAYSSILKDIDLFTNEKYVFIKRTNLLKTKLSEVYPQQASHIAKFIDDKFIDQKHLDFESKFGFVLFNPDNQISVDLDCKIT